MGAVIVKTEMIGFDRGYPITTATMYIYCDACGSFDVRTYISLSKVLPMAVVLAGGGTWLIRQNIQWILCILPLALVCLVLFMPWKFPDYQCRKCGNTKISHENSWKYPPTTNAFWTSPRIEFKRTPSTRHLMIMTSVLNTLGTLAFVV